MLAEFCCAQLRQLKLKRLFKTFKLYAMWQKQWIAHVRAGMARKLIAETFRGIYLYASQKRFKKYRNDKIKLSVLTSLKEDLSETKAKIFHLQFKR